MWHCACYSNVTNAVSIQGLHRACHVSTNRVEWKMESESTRKYGKVIAWYRYNLKTKIIKSMTDPASSGNIKQCSIYSHDINFMVLAVAYREALEDITFHGIRYGEL